jgi:8-oxoguanine deaminase
LAALLLCGAQKADRVMVAGKWKVVDGGIVGKDESELINRHSTAAKKLRQLSDA